MINLLQGKLELNKKFPSYLLTLIMFIPVKNKSETPFQENIKLYTERINFFAAVK